ncbi:glycerophosphodiester phosphodiesterase [Paraflavisolibacter sp. H34]|uniref:glycerophosphodiester phosphodiesterase n=1 Tax=Huijunlia imazamoxiresistens TaxID=3127457 RepID=UPI003015BF96
MLPDFDQEGHRGCRGLMPENTLPAFLHALQLGVTTLEMDAVITRDGQVVLSHEPFLSHEITTKPGGGFIPEAEERQYNIYRMTYDEVSRYDVGLKPHPRFPGQQKLAAVKPLLATVIDNVEARLQLSGGTVGYNIETKCTPAGDGLFHPGPAIFTDLLMQVIEAKGITDRVIIQSFDGRTLQHLHRQYPSVKTSLLVEEPDRATPEEQFKKLGFVPHIYSPEYTLVDGSVVAACHRMGVRVLPWTVNELPQMRALKKMGVDGLITDYPDLFAALEQEDEP